jgi:hypothetical protein
MAIKRRLAKHVRAASPASVRDDALAVNSGAQAGCRHGEVDGRLRKCEPRIVRGRSAWGFGRQWRRPDRTGILDHVVVWGCQTICEQRGFIIHTTTLALNAVAEKERKPAVLITFLPYSHFANT